MTQTVLGENQYLLEEQIRNRILICAGILVLAIGAGVGCVFLRTPGNHRWMLILSCLLSIGAGWAFIWNLDSFILPYRKLLKLYRRKGVTITGMVSSVSETTQRYYGFDCIVAVVDEHRLFLVHNGGITLESGQQITAQVVHGIVKEVEL